MQNLNNNKALVENFLSEKFDIPVEESKDFLANLLCSNSK